MRSWVLLATIACFCGTTAAAADPPRRTVQTAAQTDPLLEQAAERIARRTEALDRMRGMDVSQLGSREPELRLRLGELCDQNGRDARLIEDAAHQGAVDRCFDDAACDPAGLTPDRTESDRWFGAALRAFQSVAQRWPTYERADEATWYASLALDALGRPDEALDTRLGLVRAYPDSGYAIDAYVLIGDRRVDEGKPARAIAAYQRATADRDHERWEYARYRLGWARYAAGEWDAAVEDLAAVVRVRGELFEEASRDLVRFLVEAGRTAEAREVVAQLGRPDLERALSVRLAELAAEKGDFREAQDAWRRLQLAYPEADDAGAWELEAVRQLAKQGLVDAQLDGLIGFADRYGPGSDWFAAHPDRGAEVWTDRQRALRAFATDQHERSRRLRRDAAAAASAQALAGRAYERWLADHADSPERVEVQYAMAELAWDRGQHALAYGHYTEVVALDPDGPHARFCAEGAVHAAKALDDTSRFVAATDRFLARFPADPDALGMGYEAAFRLYQAERLDEALPRFAAVIDRAPRSEQATLSAELTLDVLVIREDWDGLVRMADHFATHPQLGDAAFRTEVRAVAERASFKQIEVTAATDAPAAGRAWLAWGQAHPDSELALSALHNAAVHLHDAGDVDGAMGARRALLAHPAVDPDRAFTALGALGFQHEQLADYAAAADHYEQLAERFGTVEGERARTVADALHSAAVFRDALGQPDAAIADYRAFLARFGDDPRARDGALALGRILADAGRHREAVDQFAAFVAADADPDPQYRLFARVQQARVLESLGRTEEATALYAAVAADYRAHLDAGGAPGVATTFAAESLMQLADRRYATYDAIALVGIEASMSRSEQDAFLAGLLQDKASALADVRERYAKVIETGDGRWGIAALVRIGASHEEMAEALVHSDRPTYLTEAQRTGYDGLLDDRAALQRFKAIEAYERALSKASELHLVTASTREAAERLQALDPFRPPVLPERTGPPLLDLGERGYETTL